MEKPTIEQLQHQIENLSEILSGLKTQVSELAKIYPTPIKKEKTYQWKDVFQNKGFFVSKNEILICGSVNSVGKTNIDIATTEKVCKSHLAACQLSHIIEAINKDCPSSSNIYIWYHNTNDQFVTSFEVVWSLPALVSDEAAKLLIKHHTPLLKQYFGVE